jgi:hypothetical protein
LNAYADSDVVPDGVASRVRELYQEDDFWPVYKAWYEVKARRPGVLA